jgi:hypothetical protein
MARATPVILISPMKGSSNKRKELVMKVIHVSRMAVGFVAALVLAPTSLLAAQDCRQLEEDSCKSSASCSWVNGYQRSDGRQVKAYCRTRTGKQKLESSLPPKPSDA